MRYMMKVFICAADSVSYGPRFCFNVPPGQVESFILAMEAVPAPPAPAGGGKLTKKGLGGWVLRVRHALAPLGLGCHATCFGTNM